MRSTLIWMLSNSRQELLSGQANMSTRWQFTTLFLPFCPSDKKIERERGRKALSHLLCFVCCKCKMSHFALLSRLLRSMDSFTNSSLTPPPNFPKEAALLMETSRNSAPNRIIRIVQKQFMVMPSLSAFRRRRWKSALMPPLSNFSGVGWSCVHLSFRPSQP